MKRDSGLYSWKPKTVNEFLSAVALLYKDAIFRHNAAQNPCAPDSIERLEVKRGTIGVYRPDQVRAIMFSVKEDMAVALALWFWGGMRISEVARLVWSELRSALKTGVLVITEDVGQKTEGSARSIPLLPNLRAWIQWYLVRHPDASSLVLPKKYSEGRKLDDLPRKIAIRSRIKWIENAPRHSFCTYHLKAYKDIPKLVEMAGNSVRTLQKHYWNKSNTITEETANEYFEIMPQEFAANVVPMPNVDNTALTQQVAQPSRLITMKSNRPLEPWCEDDKLNRQMMRIDPRVMAKRQGHKDAKLIFSVNGKHIDAKYEQREAGKLDDQQIGRS